MFIKPLADKLVAHRIAKIDTFIKHPHEVQARLLLALLQKAKDTFYGRTYDFPSIKNPVQFSSRVPLVSYEAFEPLIERTRKGEGNIIWPEKIKWFAKSSGTTNAKSKFIPVSNDSLKTCHFRGGHDMLALYYRNNPDTKLFQGKNLRLGGSQALHSSKKTFFGDLSAILIENIPFWIDYKSYPNKKTSLMSDWTPKLAAILSHASDEKNISCLAGVPSWMLVLLNQILTHTKQASIIDVWPHLEVFFHGGISFKPYAETYANVIGEAIRYYEIYNASEGFFAVQDSNDDKSMLLMLNHGIFYEFIPMEHFHRETPPTISLSEVELHKNYALVITTNGGLWRYLIGDTVKFTSLSPYRIVVSGRTKHYINAFGEELIIENAEEALKNACLQTNATIKDYTAGPIYMSERTNGAHEWIVEFEKNPDDFDQFVSILDKEIQKLNSDYEAKRYNDMTLRFPIVHRARKNLFYDWLEERGKLGGQNKIPRLSNTREYLEPLLNLNKQ